MESNPNIVPIPQLIWSLDHPRQPQYGIGPQRARITAKSMALMKPSPFISPIDGLLDPHPPMMTESSNPPIAPSRLKSPYATSHASGRPSKSVSGSPASMAQTSPMPSPLQSLWVGFLCYWGKKHSDHKRCSFWRDQTRRFFRVHQIWGGPDTSKAKS